jgi:hypothetical protein
MADLTMPDPGSDLDIEQLLTDLPWCVTDRTVRASMRAIVERMRRAELSVTLWQRAWGQQNYREARLDVGLITEKIAYQVAQRETARE